MSIAGRGLCPTVVVYSLNLFGDAVGDLLDPRLRGRLGRYGGGRASAVDAISNAVILVQRRRETRRQHQRRSSLVAANRRFR